VQAAARSPAWSPAARRLSPFISPALSGRCPLSALSALRVPASPIRGPRHVSSLGTTDCCHCCHTLDSQPARFSPRPHPLLTSPSATAGAPASFPCPLCRFASSLLGAQRLLHCRSYTSAAFAALATLSTLPRPHFGLIPSHERRPPFRPYSPVRLDRLSTGWQVAELLFGRLGCHFASPPATHTHHSTYFSDRSSFIRPPLNGDANATPGLL